MRSPWVRRKWLDFAEEVIRERGFELRGKNESIEKLWIANCQLIGELSDRKIVSQEEAERIQHDLFVEALNGEEEKEEVLDRGFYAG